jgi:hypothetical protein
MRNAAEVRLPGIHIRLALLLPPLRGGQASIRNRVEIAAWAWERRLVGY